MSNRKTSEKPVGLKLNDGPANFLAKKPSKRGNLQNDKRSHMSVSHYVALRPPRQSVSKTFILCLFFKIVFFYLYTFFRSFFIDLRQDQKEEDRFFKFKFIVFFFCIFLVDGR